MVHFTPPSHLILSPSGMRGIFGDSLTPDVIVKFCEAFGEWLKQQKKGASPKILVGMDSRTTGPIVKNLVLGALQGIGSTIIDVDLCPTPALLFGHKSLHCDGTVIISASHNPPIYNGMKCLAPSGTFLSKEELAEIRQFFIGDIPVSYVKWNEVIPIERKSDLVQEYLQSMKNFIDLSIFHSQKKKPLKIIVDPGAGAGVGVTSKILEDLGCEVIEINAHRNKDGTYPREFEPIQAHLKDLSQKIKETNANVGFAHDCDADRLGLIGENGEIYPEDVILALIVDYTLKKTQEERVKKYSSITMVTNCASSLMLDDLAEKYKSQIIHTPVGERYLAEKMMSLMLADKTNSTLIFGGEGSCGGYMLPTFNNTRDGIFAAVMLSAILIDTGKKVSELVALLPQYVSLRKKLALKDPTAIPIMEKLKKYLQSKNIGYEIIDNDVKVVGRKEWTLVHPSNTEPIIRIITEAPTKARAEELLEHMDKIIAFL